MSTESDERFDQVLMSVVQYNKGIDGFFDAVFGFLRRKTDFMTLEDKAKEIVSTSLQKHYAIYQEEKRKQDLLKKKQEEEKKKKELQAKKEKEETAKKNGDGATVEEVTDEEAERIMKEE